MIPRTILYLTPSSRLLGARRSLLQLATHLDPARYRAVVAVQAEGDLVAALERAGVPVRRQFLGWWRKGRYMPLRPLRVWQLARLARREGAALIHCNEFYPAPYAVRAGERLGVPVVAHMRLSISPRQIAQYGLRRAARVLCVSEAAARDFDVWPDRRERVEVAYNGVDLDEFAPRVARGEARRRLGLADGDFVVGQFGLLSPRKRPHLLIEAAALARERIPELRLLIVGSAGRSDGPYEARLHALVAERGLGEVVRFVPFTPEVVDLYTACDVNTLISNDEGFGRTIIEAAVQGIPSVGSRIGGIPELIEEGRTGLLLPVEGGGADALADGDPAALAEALVALESDAARRAELGQAARARVAERFSIAAHARQVMALYDRLLS